MLGFKRKDPIVITGENTERITRWLQGEFTPEEREKQEEARKRFEEAEKKWKVIWKDE